MRCLEKELYRKIYYREPGRREKVKGLKPVSVLRRKNEKENLQLNFKRMGLLNCYDHKFQLYICK